MTRIDFIDQLTELADWSLETAETDGQFTPSEMVNATLVFHKVLTSLAWQNFELHKFTAEQRLTLADAIGRNIHQTVLLATAIDLKSEIAGWSALIEEK